MKPASLKVLGAFACDDVRFEIGNKFTFVGVYGPDLNLVGFPCTIALKVVVLIDLPEVGLSPFAFRLMLSDGTKVADIKGSLEAVKAGGGALLPLGGPFPMTLEKPGSFALQFQTALGRWKTVHKWNFEAQSASPAPTN